MKYYFSTSSIIVAFLSVNVNAINAAQTQTQTQTKTKTCLTVETAPNVDLDAFVSQPWYVQQQAENTYTLRDYDQCVTAQYVQKGYKTFWGYDIGVYNVARNAAGEEMVGELCASTSTTKGESSGKLQVAPCFLPKWFAGPYWIVDYQEDPVDGYALISGGQPTTIVPSSQDDDDVEAEDCGLDGTSPCCKTGDGVNNSGLWIFTRQANATQELVETVRQIAKQKGFATSVLFNVTHPASCNDIPTVAVAGGDGGSSSNGSNSDRALLRGSGTD